MIQSKVVLLIALLVVSVTTLIQALIGDDHQTFYVIATTVSHLALVVIGTTFVRAGPLKVKPFRFFPNGSHDPQP